MSVQCINFCPQDAHYVSLNALHMQTYLYTHTHIATPHAYAHHARSSAIPYIRHPTDRHPMVTINGVPPLVVHAGAKAIAAGDTHSMVLKTDGTVWTTGWNIRGQLGDGTTRDKRNFVKVLSGQ